MKLADKDVQSLQSNSRASVHKLAEPQQGNGNRSSTHTRNGVHNSHAPLCHHCQESTVLQNVISKLNNAMCMVKLATFQGGAIR